MARVPKLHPALGREEALPTELGSMIARMQGRLIVTSRSRAL